MTDDSGKMPANLGRYFYIFSENFGSIAWNWQELRVYVNLHLWKRPKIKKY